MSAPTLYFYTVTTTDIPFQFLIFFFCSDNKFQDSDVIVDLDSVMAAGENTVFNIIVTEPGENTSIAANIVEDALYQSIQDNERTDETSLQLAFVNTPIISPTERENALRVRLHNTLTNEVSILSLYIL